MFCQMKVRQNIPVPLLPCYGEKMETEKKKSRKLQKTLIWFAAIAIVLCAVLVIDFLSGRVTEEITLDEAQAIVDEAFDALPRSVAKVASALLERSEVRVESLEYGSEKNIVLHCTYNTVDIASVVYELSDKLFTDSYSLYKENEAAGKKTNATKYMLLCAGMLCDALENAPTLTGSIELSVYQLSDGTLSLYLEDEAVNTCLGGILDAARAINNVKTVTYEGETVSIENMNTIRTGISDCIALTNYDSAKPNTGTRLQRAWAEFAEEFRNNFIVKNRWQYLAKGLLTTLEITLLAVLLGIAIGFLTAIVRVTHQKTGGLKFLDKLCRLYLAIIRGTPVMVQLLIIYFVILLPVGIEKFPAAVLCFGINSGAYVSEIVRGGIMSVDSGQMEAGRSLGFTYTQTMIYIVIPQAFKAVLPALANEFITLLKESSVAFYIGVADLTQGGLKIRSITYSNFMPLVAVALIYLVVVLGLSYLVGLLEKRLQKGDR